MNPLKEIADVSKYSPSSGDILQLFKYLETTKGVTRKDALEHFKQKQKSEVRFRVVYKNLKDKLIEGVFANSFKEYTTIQRAHFSVWKNQAALKIMAGAGKRNAVSSLGKETFNSAMKYGLLDAALIVARELQIYYSTIETVEPKFTFYHNQVLSLQKKLQEEILSESIYSKIVFNLRRKRKLSGVWDQIQSLEKIAKTNKEYRFNLTYFSAKNYYYLSENNQPALIKNCEKAIDFFQTYNTPLPYTTSFTFYFQMIPPLIQRKEYAKAEAYLQKCLELPSEGSYNWNLTLFLLAILGFHCDKPLIAYEAWKKANKTPKKFKSENISERWRIVLAYLIWYKKIGRINIPEDYRLGKFLNEMDIAGKDKTGQNVSVIVIQMLHYLADDDREKFGIKACRLEKYVTTYLRKKEHIRSKNFLRALKRIEDANFYLDQTEHRCRRYWRNIKEVPLTVSLDLLESELVPFEILWAEVQKLLK